MNVFSAKHRPIHLGRHPLERLRRGPTPDLSKIAPEKAVRFGRDHPVPIVRAMAQHQAMMDAIRDGVVNPARATCPDDPAKRADHLKAFAYFNDASLVGCTRLPEEARLDAPRRNPGIDALAQDLRTRQTKTLASGIDLIMADLRESVSAPASSIAQHTHALVIVQDAPRAMAEGEPGADVLAGGETHRAILRATETAVVLANYIRLLGWAAKAHSATTTEVDLTRLAVSAGVLVPGGTGAIAPFLGSRYAIAAVTTTFEMAPDAALLPSQMIDPRWLLGLGTGASAFTHDPFSKRTFAQGPHPFERLKRVARPTTYMDEANIPRVPKRTDMFARAQFGDMGKEVQKGATGGHYVRKSAPSAAQRRMLGAFVLLQDGVPATDTRVVPPETAAEMVKAASYWLGVDATGISRCPPWAWYSHDAAGVPIEPPHDTAISMIVDQGYDTMEGASGDDWISVAQSMRAYLRFSLLGGVIAQLIRDMGYAAKAHTVIDGEVLQPPLLLLSGLGEVSRIGEVILNPFLGPRLKSGVVTTDLQMTHDLPIDFGLQSFCERCNKCARECPSGAITAGPKLMFNGYEIWKSDSQKCATYRITTPGGAMCGRCMKTCPWNLEGLFAEAPFRWAAMNVPKAAPLLAKLDDAVGRGGLNPVKKWWWDLEIDGQGAYHPTKEVVNQRDLQPGLKVDYKDQTLAVYPAPLAPHPHPYPDPMDREAGIAAYADLIPAEEYKTRLANGETAHLHRYAADKDSPVLPVVVSRVEVMSDEVTLYEFRDPVGRDLPPWTAGAHLDIVVAPEYLRQYSMSGDPADRSVYQIGVLREEDGRGGSKLLHRIFEEGRRVFLAPPTNHFPLAEDAEQTLLFGGGIGITPMIAMAHRLHHLGRAFALHYCIPSRARAGYLRQLSHVPWAAHVHLHVSDEGTRADLPTLVAPWEPGHHVYTCGPDGFMAAVMDAAEARGFPEEARHLEYFSVPDLPDYVNHPFTLRLSDGRTVPVAEDQTASDALIAAGIPVDIKCADGLCGVCTCGVRAGEVEHRDFVLSNAQRETQMILCQSRAAAPNGEIEITL